MIVLLFGEHLFNNYPEVKGLPSMMKDEKEINEWVSWGLKGDIDWESFVLADTYPDGIVYENFMEFKHKVKWLWPSIFTNFIDNIPDDIEVTCVRIEE